MKTLYTYTAILALLIAMPAAAQQPQQDGPPHGHGMMQGGMMQNMQMCMTMMQSMQDGMMGSMQDRGMQDPGMQGRMMNGANDRGGMMDMTGMMQQPMHPSMMLVHVLPTMQEPLNLNDTQVARLQEMHEELKASHGSLHEQMQADHAQLRELTGQDDADPSAVERLLKSTAEQHAEMQASMFATAQKMRNVLSAEQRTALADMRPADIHRHMMQNMSMMEMMQTMQTMHGAMMQGGMMQGGMNGMQGGSMSPRMQDGAPQDHQRHHGGNR